METILDEPTDEVALRASVQSVCLQLLSSPSDASSTTSKLNVTGSAVLSVSELTYIYATQCLGPDLVAFAQHRKNNNNARTRITAEDVLLAARKNPSGVLDQLQAFLGERRQQAATTATWAKKPANATKKATHQHKSAPKAKQNEESLSSSSDGDESIDQVYAQLRSEKQRGFASTTKPAESSPPPSSRKKKRRRRSTRKEQNPPPAKKGGGIQSWMFNSDTDDSVLVPPPETKPKKSNVFPESSEDEF